MSQSLEAGENVTGVVFSKQHTLNHLLQLNFKPGSLFGRQNADACRRRFHQSELPVN